MEPGSSYFEKYPPLGAAKWESERKGKVGVIVVHDINSIAHLKPGDGGSDAIALAEHLRKSTYRFAPHVIADHEGWVWICRPEWTAFHEKGVSHRAFGMLIAATGRWSDLDATWLDGAVSSLAMAAAEASDYLEEAGGQRIGAKMITTAQADAGETGFLPAKAFGDRGGFDWEGLLDAYRRESSGVDSLDSTQETIKLTAAAMAAEEVSPTITTDIDVPAATASINQLQRMLDQLQRRQAQLDKANEELSTIKADMSIVCSELADAQREVNELRAELTKTGDELETTRMDMHAMAETVAAAPAMQSAAARWHRLMTIAEASWPLLVELFPQLDVVEEQDDVAPSD